MKAAIGHRLDRLSEGCAAVLHVAAVLGKVFEFPVLLGCAAVGEDALLDALDEAAAAQLVLPLERESFAFTHDKIREVLIEELNPIRVRRLHLKVAEVLASRSDARPEDLSYHYLLAGELEPALKWSLAASERAVSVFALAEAANHLSRARECVEALGDPASKLEVLGALARLQSMRGDAPATMAACREALPLSRTAGERLEFGIIAAESAVAIAHPDAEKLIDAAEAELPPGDVSVRKAMLLGLRGRVFHYRIDHAQALKYYEQALALPSIADDPEVEGRTFTFMAGNFQQLARLEESMQWARRCVDLGRSSGRPELEASGHEFLSEDLNALGRPAEALEHAKEDMRLGLRAGSLDRQAWSLFCAMWANLNLGQLAEVLESGVLVRDLCETLGEQRLLGFASIPGSVAAGESGDEGLTDEWLALGIAACERVNQLNLKAFVWGSRARVAMMRGDPGQGLALVREGLAMREGSASVIGADRLLAHGALAAALTGDLGTADAYAKRGFEYCEAHGAADALCVLHRAVAATALARRRPDEALAQLAKAIAAAESGGRRIEQGHALVDRAALARTMGRDADAGSDLARARVLATACGAGRLLARLG